MDSDKVTWDGTVDSDEEFWNSTIFGNVNRFTVKAYES